MRAAPQAGPKLDETNRREDRSSPKSSQGNNVDTDENDDDDDPNDDGSESSRQSTDEASTDEEEEDTAGISEYERMRNERIKRNQARLQSLGLTQGNNIPQKKKKKKTTPKPRKSLELLPTRELPSRAGRATFMESVYRKERKENNSTNKEEEKNADLCFTCQVEGGGEMLYIQIYIYFVFLLCCAHIVYFVCLLYPTYIRTYVLRLLPNSLPPQMPPRINLRRRRRLPLSSMRSRGQKTSRRLRILRCLQTSQRLRNMCRLRQ